MTTQLITVFNGFISRETTLLCDARELHAFLGAGKRFASWITERIAEYEFIENQDYVIASQNWEAKKSLPTEIGEPRIGRGGHNRKDYHLTLDTAKELAMVERNEKGRQIRRYFIDCEKKLRQQFTPPAPTYPPFSDDYHNRTEIIYYQDFKPIFSRILKSHEIVSSPESLKEWLEMKGLILLTRDELKNLTLHQLLAIAG